MNEACAQKQPKSMNGKKKKPQANRKGSKEKQKTKKKQLGNIERQQRRIPQIMTWGNLPAVGQLMKDCLQSI